MSVTRAIIESRTRRLALGVVSLAAAAAVALPGTATAAAHLPQVYPVTASSGVTLSGHGYGHGHGMSQWGAYGAAQVHGMTAPQILAFYYPGTTLNTQSTKTSIRVLLTAVDASDRGVVQVLPSAGLTLHGGSHRTALPTQVAGAPVSAWQLTSTAGVLALRAKTGSTWTTVTPGLGTSASFTAAGGEVSVVLPGGQVAPYRGRVYGELQNGAMQAVDKLPLESYLDSVVPAEMPASWPSASLQSQAVAARTYAGYVLAHPRASWYDINGDTSDQAYPGVNSENPASTAAVTATAGQVLQDASGNDIFAQYDASDGGWTVAGGQSYLTARKDPYDGAVPNAAHSWSTTLSAASLARAYPGVGTMTSLTVTSRDGHGQWGGRVLGVTITGSTGSVSVSGTAFAAQFSLMSPWWSATS